MFALFVTVKIRPGHRDEFIEATMGDAIGSNNDEPGCLRFDVHADSKDENTVYLYEVYKDRESWEVAHRTAPHYTKWRETVSDWFDGGPEIVELNPVYNAEVGRI
jgi:autoinducer 2-degrading protein